MMWVYALSGRIAFWLSWPLSYVYLRRTPRTRVLVRADDAVLLVRNWHSAGGWSLPGGGLHGSETPEAGAVRELREETGVVVNPAALQPLGLHTHQAHGLRFTCYYFAVVVKEQTTVKRQLPEVLEVRWIPLHELSPRTLAVDVRHALQAAGTLPREPR